jgi:sugar lactone lactonase YvrE
MMHRLWKVGLLLVILLIAAPAPVKARPAAPAPLASASLPDGVADRVLGQAAFNTNAPSTSATSLWLPAGVAINRASDRLFVVEYGYMDGATMLGNHRVLSWSSAQAFTSGQPADLVIGQPGFATQGGGLGADLFYGPEAAAVDTSGNLWVADTENNRVLRFDQPFSNGMSASLVLGQPDFDSNAPNRGGGVAANTLYYPRGLAMDAAGYLYVADDANNRVLRYSPPFSNGMDADVALGQENLTSGEPNRGLFADKNTLNRPKGIAIDEAGNLYVAEYDNNRVTRYAFPFYTGMDASGVYGQANYFATVEGTGASGLSHPVDVAVSADGAALYVTDQWNVRVLGYANPLSDAVADQVYGQPDFTSSTPNNGGISASSINEEPLGLAVDAKGALYHADFRNNRLLAYDTVSQVVGDGTPGSCSEAALDTALASGGIIGFDCGGAAQINFSGAKTINFGNSVTLDGGGEITLSGGGVDRLFVVSAGAALTLRDIILTGGYSSGDGGAIYNEGVLALEKSTLRDNQSGLSGGGIVNYGSLTITDSLLEGNRALNGGALYPRWGTSQTSVTRSVLRDNHATDTTDGWGGAILAWDGAHVTITESEISANTAQYGGGIYNYANSTLVLQVHTRLDDNVADLNGGGLLNYGSVSLDFSSFSGNSAGGTGGGVYNGDNLFFNQVSISGNSAGAAGGGLYNSSKAYLYNATLDGNTTVSSGGGVANFGNLEMTNATLSGNSANVYGGGLDNGGVATLTNVTLSNNSALQGGGIYNELALVVNLKNSLVANSPQGGNCGGDPITSDKYSLSSDNTCSLAGAGSLNGVDPLLTPLGDFGGWTLVHMLKTGSPAIDGVAGSDAPFFDQRGQPRPAGGGYDIGAVERQPTDSELPPRLYLPMVIR